MQTSSRSPGHNVPPRCRQAKLPTGPSTETISFSNSLLTWATEDREANWLDIHTQPWKRPGYSTEAGGRLLDRLIVLRDRSESSLRVERKYGFEMLWRSFEGRFAPLRQYSGECQRHVARESAAKWKAHRNIVRARLFFARPVIRVRL